MRSVDIPLAKLRMIQKEIPLNEGHRPEMVRQNARRQQPCDTAPQNDGMLSFHASNIVMAEQEVVQERFKSLSIPMIGHESRSAATVRGGSRRV